MTHDKCLIDKTYQLMKPLLTFTYCILFIYAAGAQRVITLDPEKDAIARRTVDGVPELAVPVKALAASIQNAFPEITSVDSVSLKKIGRSQFLLAYGTRYTNAPENIGIAILLVETSPGQFQTDDLAVICSSSGDCRECASPPTCSCSKGQGNCSQSAALTIQLKKVTVTLYD